MVGAIPRPSPSPPQPTPTPTALLALQEGGDVTAARRHFEEVKRIIGVGAFPSGLLPGRAVPPRAQPLWAGARSLAVPAPLRQAQRLRDVGWGGGRQAGPLPGCHDRGLAGQQAVRSSRRSPKPRTPPTPRGPQVADDASPALEPLSALLALREWARGEGPERERAAAVLREQLGLEPSDSVGRGGALFQA
jgi:hypothetical protein